MKKFLSWFLSFPTTYSTAMRLFVATKQRYFLSDFIDAPSGSLILDIGCGPASILRSLKSEIEYTGIDSNPKYISMASKQFGDRAKFVLLDVDELANRFTERFDTILILGTLHHLSSTQAQNLLQIAHGLLARDGTLITHDPVRSANQNLISKFLMNLDRGKYIRYEKEHLGFFDTHFEYSSTIKNDVMRFPYQIIYVKAKKKLA
jgi:SAM-dependent methyltransferase